MARHRFPDESVRMLYDPGKSQGNFLANAIDLEVQIFTDQAATVLADIQTPTGTAIQNSTLTVDENSLIPLFLGPDDVKTVYGQVVGTSATFALMARYDDRLAAIEALLGL